MNPTELLDGLKKDVDRNIAVVTAAFTGLTYEQLNWKPAPETWSIAQCIDHLNVYDKLYLVRFRKVLITGKKLFFARDHYKPSLLGNYFIRMVDPKIGVQKYQAAPIYLPAQSDIDIDVLAEFTRLQLLLKDMIEKAKRYDIRKNKIYTPVSELVRLRFGDAFIIVVRHDQRHLQQAQRVMNHPNFPMKR